MSEKVQFQTNVPIEVTRIVWIAPESTLWTELVSRLHCRFNLRNSELLPKVRRWRLNGRHFAARHCLSEEKTDMACPDCSSSAGDFRIVTSVETHGLDCGPYETFNEEFIVCRECGGRIDLRDWECTPEIVLSSRTICG